MKHPDENDAHLNGSEDVRAKLLGKRMMRSFEVRTEEAAIDEEKRTVKVAFSSEEPVSRWFGMEILDHTPASADLSRLNNSAAVLWNHRMDQQIGVVENASIGTDRMGRATLRFSKNNPDAEMHFRDIVDGIKSKISFIYDVGDIVLEKTVNDVKYYRVSPWIPYEISLVSLPADDTVGVGRSIEEDEELDRKIEEKIRQFNKPATETVGAGQSHTQQGGSTMEEPKQPTQEEILRAERERVDAIETFAKRFSGRVSGIDEMKATAVSKGTSFDEFKAQIAVKMSEGGGVITPESEIGMTEKETKSYSLLRLIQHQLSGGKVKADLEIEASKTIAKRINREAKGAFVPWEIQNRQHSIRVGSRAELDALRAIAVKHGLYAAARAMDTTTTGGAKELVGTDLRADLFVEMLRARSVAGRVGVQVLVGLQGNLAIPKQSAAATWEWTGETGTTTGSKLTTAQITMSPKEGRAYQEYHRMLLLQSNPSIELLVQNDLLAIARLGVDKAVFHGSGASNQPKGIANESGVGSVSGVGIGWDGIVEFEGDVASADADIGSMFYIMHPTVRSLLKTRPNGLVGQSAAFLMALDGMVNGYPSIVSTQITSTYIFFGDFSQELLGYWGNLDLLVNPYVKDNEAITRVNVYADVDCALRQAGAISIASDVS